MTRLVENDECERCESTTPATQRLCPECARAIPGLEVARAIDSTDRARGGETV